MPQKSKQSNTNPLIFLQLVNRISGNPCGCYDILSTMNCISNHISPFSKSVSAYNTQRKILTDLFLRTSGSCYSKENIMLRLIALDSLYSTNASKTYFSIENIADEIWNIPGNGTNEDNANLFFYEVAKGNKGVRGINVDDWFNKPFGIQKNCKQGHRMVSLLTKYAYFCLAILGSCCDGFPIYDSLALVAYPFAFKILWANTLSNQDIELIINTLSPNPQKNIPVSLYINAMHTLCNGLGLTSSTFPGLQKYDVLDAYLWRMGKFCNGNLSLLLDKQGYEEILNQLSLKANPKEKDSDYFKRMSGIHSHCMNKTIQMLKPNGVKNMSYPSIYNNKICKEPILEYPKKNITGTFGGNLDALVLYSLISKTKSQFTFSNQYYQKYFNILYKHWFQHYNK